MLFHVTSNQLLCDTCHVISCEFMASNYMKHTVRKRISITILLRIKLLSRRNAACGVTVVTFELSTTVVKETAVALCWSETLLVCCGLHFIGVLLLLQVVLMFNSLMQRSTYVDQDPRLCPPKPWIISCTVFIFYYIVLNT